MLGCWLRTIGGLWLGLLVLCAGAVYYGRSMSPSPKAVYLYRPDSVAFFRVLDLRTMAHYDFPVVHSSNRTPLWSPDGRYIYFRDRTNAEFELDIYAHDTTTGRNRRLYTEPLNQHPVDLSPDGRYLAYLSEMPGTPLMGYVYDLYTGARSPTLFSISDLNDLRFVSFAWSHGSRYLLFTEQLDLYRYDTQTDYIDALLKGEMVLRPQWLPDDTAIAYYEGDDVRVYDLTTYTIETQLADFEERPRLFYAPDGAQAVYIDSNAQGLDIVHIDLTTNATRPLVTTRANDMPLRWLSATVLLYQVRYDAERYVDLYEINVATGATQFIQRIPTLHTALWYPDEQ